MCRNYTGSPEVRTAPAFLRRIPRSADRSLPDLLRTGSARTGSCSQAGFLLVPPVMKCMDSGDEHSGLTLTFGCIIVNP